MVVQVCADADAAARMIADRLDEALRRKPTLVLGLPTGRTPLPLYDELARRYAGRAIDFSRVTTFNLDEFVGCAPDQRGSFRLEMEERFFSRVNVPANRIGFLDGVTPDLNEECRRYEQAIAAAGGIDILLLGIGTNGHIGFNEPGDGLMASTHCATLHPSTRASNAPLFGGEIGHVPTAALTMGIGTILRAREIILMAFGGDKAGSVREAVQGTVTTRIPASFLQLHPRVTLFLDGGAASRLSGGSFFGTVE